MNEQNDRELREFLKSHVPNVRDGLERDLWPDMLRRMERGARQVPWFDWALAGAVAAALLLFPRAIPVLFYHL
ncbi:MAG TPA: hypothetical protein VEG64_05725 [Candidatus Sulfotelmatobacter sp.]|nr:hypothetical protein [Candidatus Sulfotelmatobacter sp.]